MNAVEALTVALLRERGEDADLHPRVVQSLDAENSGLRSARMMTIEWRCSFARIVARAKRDPFAAGSEAIVREAGIVR